MGLLTVRSRRRRQAYEALAVLALLCGLVGSPREAQASRQQFGVTNSGPDMRDLYYEEPHEMPPLTESQAQGYGCLLAGSTATAVTMLAGANEIVLVIAGGTLVPTSPFTLGIVVVGTVFASICAVGALATPAVLHMWDYYNFATRPFGGHSDAGPAVEQ